MKILPPTPDSLRAAVALLHAGGIVAHATETCYGLACNLSNATAVARLFAVKERPPLQSVSGLFASIDQAKEYVLWNARAEELAAAYLPGPLTLILPLRPSAPMRLYPQSGETAKPTTIGVRISSHPLALQLVTLAGFPLSTTSGNLHGQPNPYSAEDIVTQFSQRSLQPDLILDSGTLPVVPPSTVMDLTSDGTVLRKGTV